MLIKSERQPLDKTRQKPTWSLLEQHARQAELSARRDGRGRFATWHGPAAYHMPRWASISAFLEHVRGGIHNGSHPLSSPVSSPEP